MSETKHTPGPWKADKAAIGEYWQVWGDCRVVAEVYGTSDIDPSWAVRPGANARLIAAAPDLLDALQKISKELRTSNDRMKMIEAIEKLTNAALAKTEE